MVLHPSETVSQQAERSARFYDRLAPSYETELTRWRGDLWTRSAFRHQVLRRLPPGSRLLDFGCGPGIDARFYAGHGYRVTAYDNSAGMMEVLKRRLRPEIEHGRVEPVTASYETFLADLGRHEPFAGVVANFAVLNQIADLEPLFAALAENVAPAAFLLANVLNPFFWREAVVPSRWPALVSAVRSGYVLQAGEHVDTYRHTPGAITRMAAPHWTPVSRQSVGVLVRYHGAPRIVDWNRPSTLAEKVDVRWGGRFPVDLLGRYLILSFQRKG